MKLLQNEKLRTISKWLLVDNYWSPTTCTLRLPGCPLCSWSYLKCSVMDVKKTGLGS
jgi:hypothetical protein